MQPNTPNHPEVSGTAISHSQDTPTQIDIAAKFDRVANKYAELLIDKKVRTSKSDTYLLEIITDCAKRLYKHNLSLITVENGYDNYTANVIIYLPNLGNISLNYNGENAILLITLMRGKNILPLPAFECPQIWDEYKFVEFFIYGGKHQKPDQSQNRVFNFFDCLLLDYVTE
jgi:hypothetical protein